MDENSICRLCALKSDNYIKVFDKQGENLQLAEKIKQCLQIWLIPEDLLPNTVCLTCCDKVKEYSDFYELCSQSQCCLMELLGHQSNNSVCNQIEDNLENDTSNEPSTVEDEIAELSPPVIETVNKDVNNIKVKMEDRKICVFRSHSFKKNIIDKRNSKPDGIIDEPTENKDGCKLEKNDEAFNNTGWFNDYFEKRPPVSTRKMMAGYIWKCTNCDQELSNLNSLKLHYDKEHNEPPSFKCTSCNKVYTRYRSFVRHVKLHWNKECFSCHVCGKDFSQKCILQSHMAAHSEERPFVCTKCGKAFKQYSSLYLHSKCHLPEEAKPKYPCTICSKIVCSKSAMDTHMKIHTGEKNFICDICGKRFIAKGSLHYHIQTHDERKPYSCKICNKSFKTTRLLSKHTLLHTGQKPHQCDVCGKQFRERSALKEHYRIHTGDMPYSCEYCGKNFRFKGILTVHRRQHTGERPYQCAICSHEFTNWANYNKHLKRRHKPGSDIEENNDENRSADQHNQQQQLGTIQTVQSLQLQELFPNDLHHANITDTSATLTETSTPTVQDVFSLEPTLYDNLPLDLAEPLSDLYRGPQPSSPTVASPSSSLAAASALQLYYLHRYIRYPEFLPSSTMPVQLLSSLLEESSVRPR